MLDIEQFDKIPYGAIFRGGWGSFPSICANEPIRYIVKKGGGNDWAIYYHHIHKNEETVAKHGEKVTGHKAIRMIMPCTDEVFKLYRF